MELSLPVDPDEHRNAILEVRAGTGGEEAALFAADLLHMYERFSSQMGWKFKIVNISKDDQYGGYKEASATVSGYNVFGGLKFESGNS